MSGRSPRTPRSGCRGRRQHPSQQQHNRTSKRPFSQTEFFSDFFSAKQNKTTAHTANTQYTPAELALAGLWWTGPDNFAVWSRHWLPEHIGDIRKLLESDKIRLGPNARPPQTPQDANRNAPNTAQPTPEAVRNARTKVPAGFTARDVLSALPESYVAPEFRGVAYRQQAFRDWHIVSHRAFSLDTLNEAAQAAHNAGILDWAYEVSAQTTGHSQHVHAILSFRHAHPERYVRELLGLKIPGALLWQNERVENAHNRTPEPPEDADTHLAPIHGSFEAAVDYLRNQATRTIEIGKRPEHRIVIDGNNVVVRNRRAALTAIANGERTDILQNAPIDRNPQTDEFASILMWIKHHSARNTANARWNNVQHAPDNDTADRLALAAARSYSGKIYAADFRGMIPGSCLTQRPSGWYGHEVVLLKNVPPELVDRQLKAPWLRAVPEVVYTTDSTPPQPFVQYTHPPPEEDPTPQAPQQQPKHTRHSSQAQITHSRSDGLGFAVDAQRSSSSSSDLSGDFADTDDPHPVFQGPPPEPKTPPPQTAGTTARLWDEIRAERYAQAAEERRADAERAQAEAEFEEDAYRLPDPDDPNNPDSVFYRDPLDYELGIWSSQHSQRSAYRDPDEDTDDDFFNRDEDPAPTE